MIDADRVTQLGVELRDVEATIAEAFGTRQLAVLEPVVLSVPGRKQAKLDVAWVRARSGDRIPLARVVTLRAAIAPASC